LLKFGADIGAPDNNDMTPLQLAESFLSQRQPKFVDDDLKEAIEWLRGYNGNAELQGDRDKTLIDIASVGERQGAD
jgi:hypothetical protein